MNRFAALLLVVLAVAPVRAEIYELPPPGVDVIGNVTVIKAGYDDTLVDIARRHGLGYHDVVRANPDVNVWLPGEGTDVVLPTRFVLPSGPREGVVLNLAEYRMYFYPEANPGEPAYVITYPISIGRMDWETPLGLTSVVAKVVNPSWYPPASVHQERIDEGRPPLPRIVPPGPDNPLGSRAMRLGLPGYLIHGTNRPAGVGMRVTHGCIRMFPEDIEFLFDRVPVKTRVRILNEPIKVGWDGDELVMEVHPVLEVAPAVTVDEPNAENAAVAAEVIEPSAEEERVVAASEPVDEASADDEAPVVVAKDPLTYATESFIAATRERPGRLDWSIVEALIGSSNGMPATVGVSVPVEEGEGLVTDERGD